MPDPKGWISRIKEIEPPDFWREANRRMRAAGVEEPGARQTLPTFHHRAETPRIAALITGVAAGVLALIVVLVSLRTEPLDRGRPTPTPPDRSSALMEVHQHLEELLGEFWTVEADAGLLRGEINAARDELARLLEASEPDPTKREQYRIFLLEQRIQAWMESLREAEARLSVLRTQGERLREQRDRLVPPSAIGDYPDVATVTCDGDATGGTHLSTPVVRAQRDGVHIRVVNRISNEQVFLLVQPGGSWPIPPGATREFVMRSGRWHDVEVACTHSPSRVSWERTTHPLWIAGIPDCADDADRRNAAPVEDGGEVSVYFSCEADGALLGTDRQPVYMFARSVPDDLSGTPDGRLEAALRAYLAGPTPDEADLGYFTPAPASLAAALQDVSVVEGTAAVDFTTLDQGGLGNLGTSTASLTFLLELRALAFQFPDVQQLVLRVDGDCEGFWHMLEMSCQTIRRHDGCPTAPLLLTRVPWLPFGSSIPGPELVQDRFGSTLVWFEDADLRWAGPYAAIKRSSRPLVGYDLSGFPTLRVRGGFGHLVWIGDPGIGELALVWREGVEPCSWFSLSMSSVGLTETAAEREIRTLVRFFSDLPLSFELKPSS